MAVKFCSLTPIEAEYYATLPELQQIVDSVGQMIMDMHDEPIDLDIVLAINDEEDPTCFTLAFGGTTLSLDFYPDRIDITDFDLADGNESEVIETFDPLNVNGATLWLINQLEN